jgi:tryptophanyl-tRNA synthetase
MAADILIYDSDVVPVGKDQKQHLEVTRDIATKINETFGSEPDGHVFKLPEPRIQSSTETVPGLDGQKMSKSYGNTLDIFGEEKEMRKRVMGIVTDSTPVEAPKDPDSRRSCSLFVSRERIGHRRDARGVHDGGTGYGEFKKRLFGALWEYFAPMRARRDESRAADYIDDVLSRGAARESIADQVMCRVRDAVGL